MKGILKRIFIIFLFLCSFIIEVGEDNEFIENNENFLNKEQILNNSGVLNGELQHLND